MAVTATSTAGYPIPNAWTLESSSIVENKAIHVWSKTADLVATVGSHTQSSGVAGDVMSLIPTSALGMSYVAASYAGPREGLPSEFTVTATHDNTVINILPTADLRRETVPDGNNWTAAHSKGILFTDTLQRGQAIQYKALFATKDTGFDVTGTTVHSNYPISVVGASMNTSIPLGAPDYSNDYICDMLPPVENWDKLYYSSPIFYSAFPVSNIFLVVGSKAAQSIYYQDTNGVKSLFYATQRPFDFHFDSAWGLGVWSSDAPFLLIEYGRGRSATTIGTFMSVVAPPGNQGGTSVLPVPGPFLSPAGGNNRVNLIYNSQDHQVQVDGALLFGTGSKVDAKHSISYLSFTFFSNGTHIIQSDSGVSALVFNYSFDEASAHPMLTGSFTGPADRDAPRVTFSETATCTHASISDSGYGISRITIDSVLNFTVTIDPSFRPNESMRSGFVDLCIPDSFTNCYARFTVWDMADNRSEVEVRYNEFSTTLPKPGFTVQSIGFDTVRVGTSKTIAAVTVQDTSKLPISITKVWSDNLRFTYNENSPSSNRLPIYLQPGESRSLAFTFTPAEQLFYQTIGHAYSPTAGTMSFPLTGAGYIVEEQAVTPSAALPNLALVFDGRSVMVHVPAGWASVTRLEIVNILGQTVLSCNMEAGRSFDVAQLPHGIYFYHFSNGRESVTGKIVL